MDRAKMNLQVKWRIRKNKKLWELYQSPSIIEDITKEGLNGHSRHKEGILLRNR